MKAKEAGICSEVGISYGDFLHVCALPEGHDDDHECACGSIIDQDEIATYEKGRKEK